MKLLPILTASTLLATSAAQADWVLVKDFEGADRAANFSKMYFDLHVPMDPEWGGYSPLVTFPEDPARAGNHVMNDVPVGAGFSIGWLESFALIDIKPNVVPAGSKGTLYFEMYTTGLENNALIVGFAPYDVGPGDPLFRAEGWGDGSPDLPLANIQDMNWRKVAGVLSFEDGIFGARGHQFDPSLFPVNEWISFWLVGDTNTNTFQIWVKSSGTSGEIMGPLEGAQEQEDGSFVFNSTFNFRNTDFFGQALQSVFIGTVAGDPEDPYLPWNTVYLDNIYLDPTSENISMPSGGGGEMWADWQVESSGWVDTGAFLGHIYPMGDWVWSASLATWIYLPESFVAEGGAWTWVAR